MPISNVNTSNYVPRPPPATRADTMDKIETRARNEPPPKVVKPGRRNDTKNHSRLKTKADT